MHKSPLVVAGIVFGLVALIHLARLYFQFPLIVGSVSVPLWANGVGFIVAVALSYWMFSSANRGCR